MTERAPNGSRRVALFCPFEADGQTIAAVEFRPVTLGDTMAAQAGVLAGPMSLLASLTGLSEETLAMLRYPDVTAVMSEFMFHLPPDCRDAITRSPMAYQPGGGALAPGWRPEPRGDDEPTGDDIGEALDDTNAELGEFASRFPPMPAGYVNPKNRPEGGFSLTDFLAKQEAEGSGWRDPRARQKQAAEQPPGAAMGLDLGDGK